MPTPPGLATPFPLVGRDRELAQLHAALDDVSSGQGRTILIRGESGIGKTRLVMVLRELATERGWTVALGRAYPVESGVPYAVVSDAILPLLRRIDAATLQTLTRGGAADLARICPSLALEARGSHDHPFASGTGSARADAVEAKARTLWTFAQLLARYSTRQPLLLILENLQWADASSLELLHFAARQLAGEHVMVLGTYQSDAPDAPAALAATEQSLIGLGVATVLSLEPLSRAATEDLVARLFGAERAVTREFTALLYGWTRGNPFFVEETLKGLVSSGHLRQQDGTWLGWELEELHLPRSIREAVMSHMNRLSPPARAVANLAAVIGAETTHEALAAVSGLTGDALFDALDELRRERVLMEVVPPNTVAGRTTERWSGEEGGGGGGPGSGDPVTYDFAHPMMQDALYAELGRARTRALHGQVADALERFYGACAMDHAGELALHYSRAATRGGGAGDGAGGGTGALAGQRKAVTYLIAAGREALARSANREAANYLASALDLVRATGGAALDVPPGDAEAATTALMEDLARTRQRLGEYDAALALWAEARAQATARGDRARLAAIERRMGLACFWSGQYNDALTHYAAGLEALHPAAEAGGASGGGGDEATHARLRIAMGMCLLEVGRQGDAKREVASALAIAERLGDPALLARVNRALTLLHVWTGPPDEARRYGRRAIELAAVSGQRVVGWQAHWAMAMLEGLTGNAPAIAQHIAESERLADELRSPVLRLWTAEVSIEYLSGIGDWDAALALGERTIALARTLGQRTLLPRLLVWCGLIYLGRGDLPRAKAAMDEAWQLSGAGQRSGSGRPQDVHTVVPAHAGRAAYHLAVKEYRQAIRDGERGLEIADRTGYVAWALHRLLPVMAEASLWLADFERAQRYGARLRRDARQLGHRLGEAWADACDALVEMLRGDKQAAITQLRSAADELDAVPFVADGARLRRQLARALAETGDRDAAVRELRRVHDVFARLGAQTELAATREQMKELGARAPARATPTGRTSGEAGLTDREAEIVRLVAERKSNKEIGRALGISPRTVSTHLSNIFVKLQVASRGELTDVARARMASEAPA